MNGSPSIAPASLWSRPKVQEFIQHVRTDPGSVLVVGRGETITVRVPTHENGKKLNMNRFEPYSIVAFFAVVPG